MKHADILIWCAKKEVAAVRANLFRKGTVKHIYLVVTKF